MPETTANAVSEDASLREPVPDVQHEVTDVAEGKETTEETIVTSEPLRAALPGFIFPVSFSACCRCGTAPYFSRPR